MNERYEKPEIYQIKVKGILAKKWSDWFDGFTITAQDENETIMVGTILDQGALHGVLAKIRDLGLPLISVERLEKQTTRKRIMKKFERFTVRHPIGFGFILIVLYSLLGTLTWPVTQIYPYPEGHEWGTTLGKLIIAACFIGLVWRFGWLKRAGYQHSGGARIWMIVIPLMIYKVFLSIYVFTGAWTFKLPSLALMTAIIFRSLATSLLEESIYRGLLLPAMLQAWGNTRRGVVLSAAISGLFWGSLHLFNLLVRPFPIVFSQVMSITLVGFYYAVFVISSRSIWPAVVFHWVINTTVNLALSQNPAFEETITHWVGLSAISILPILVSLWLLKTNRSSEIEH